ncbi:MAG: 8-amino-7-oxononanoate synthase [Steroidobacteraceae bacterium]
MVKKRQPLAALLEQIDQQHLRRRRVTVEAYPQPDSRAEVMVGGRRLVDFSSNDYLGLAAHPALAAAMATCATRCGAGSGASHLISGHGQEHAALEEELAAFTGRPRALLFSTGYMANLGVVTALAGRGESVLLDRLSHASLIDAGLLSGARFRRYPHCDAAAARRLLAESTPQTAVVATDGVFSMDGDIAPLTALSEAARAHEAWLVVDDAHGIGVLGANGRGALELAGLDCEAVPVLVGTLGKAFGSFGAFVAGAEDLIELLIQHARSYIYTTALPQPVAAATRAALRIAQQESWRRDRVLALTARFRAAARQAGVPLADSRTPIQPIPLGSSQVALATQHALREAGFWVVAIRSPTVPAGTERLRITLTAGHEESQVDALVEALSRICAARPIP